MSEEITVIPEHPIQQRRRMLPFAAMVVAVLALAASGWQWLDNRHRGIALEQVLTQRLSQFDDRSRESMALSRLAEESTAKSAAKITLIEQQLDESRSQQDALQTLYLELASNRDAWIFTEVEQLLVIASQQLQLAGNIKPALLALQTAESRLQHIDKPQVIQLRKIINQDIQRLQALPSVDLVGMTLKIDALIDATDKLPLLVDRHPKPETPTAPDFSPSPWDRLAQEIWQDIRHMVRIERMDQPEQPLLAPEQSYFLRENLKLRLLSARIALLQHDEATYRLDLQTTDSWIRRHFDTSDPVTQKALENLHSLSSSDISIEVPDISDSLNAVSKYKLSLEGNAQ